MKKFVVLAAFAALVLAGCSRGGGSDEELPEARTLLDRSAEAMSQLTSLAFNLSVEGDLSSFQVKDAVGVITADGRAKATAQINQGGQVVEYEYVLADGKSYLKGPTGGFREIPPEIVARFFNPTTLLNGERNLSQGLASSTEAETEDVEEVDGVDAYRIKAKVNPSRIEGLSLLASGRSEEAMLWIDRESNHLVKAVMPFEVGDRETTVNVTFSKFNENVEIAPPI